MIYLDPGKPVLNTVHFNSTPKSNYSGQTVIKNSNQEFFKTRLTKEYLIYFMSSRVEPNTTYVVGHDNPDADSVCSAIAYEYLQNRLIKQSEKKNKKKSHKKFVAVCPGEPNSQTAFILRDIGVKMPDKTKDMDSLRGDRDHKRVALIDHNQISQSIDGITVESIEEIIDHHAMAYKGVKPVAIHTEPVGATATIVANMYKANNVAIPPKIAGILLGAILSDTFNLKANATQKDKDMAEYLAVRSGIDRQGFGDKLMEYMYMKDYDNLKEKPANEIVKSDLKPYFVGSQVLCIGQIFIKDYDDFLKKRKADVLKYMNNPYDLEYMNSPNDIKRRPDYMVLMITNIEKEETCLLFTDKSEEIVKKAFKKEIKGNTMLLLNTLSRKTQVEQQLKDAIE